jgi:hypothetical protein
MFLNLREKPRQELLLLSDKILSLFFAQILFFANQYI